MFSDAVDNVIEKNKIPGINRIVIPENLLFESAKEEIGNPDLSLGTFRSAIDRYLNEEQNDEDVLIVLGALYAAQVVSNHCFSIEYNEDYDQPFSHIWVRSHSPDEFSVIITKVS